MQSGQGKLTKKNKDIIEGQFRNGKMDGQIIIHYADGSKFRGMYRNGKRNGAAIEQDKKGIRFEGSYRNDVRDGKFTETDRNGKIVAQGYYENGIRHNN